jgi:type VI secretion system protein VasD
MRRAIALLFATALLSGCTTVGNVLKKTGQVLMDPDIQVGAADDQPTQIALSLYADMDVNPNPVAEPDVDPRTDEALDEGPFAINLHSDTREELVRNLRALLNHLQDEPPVVPAATTAIRQSPAFKLNADPTRPSFVVSPGFNVSPADPVATYRAPFPAHWRLRHGAVAAAQDPESQQGEVAAEEMDGVALGQYREGLTLAPAPVPSARAFVNATPVAFRVIQLKDDSLLENADPDQVRREPKKALGSTYLTADDYLLVPGQFKFINYSALDEDTRYVAVVAAFHAPNAQRWYDVFRVEPRGHKYALLVTLQETRVAITDESYRPAQAARHASTPARKQP